MKVFLKSAAIVSGAAGGILLGWLINLALTEIPYFALALVVVLALIFVGATALIALFIFLWAKANGELDVPPAGQDGQSGDQGAGQQ